MKQKILLDQHFKNILRNKLILAYIMKDNLDEYANSSIGEIMKCIEPQGDVPLHTHLISGHRNENNEDDVSVVFDSLVYASLPHDDKRKIAMIINLEAQGELKGRSHVLSRANYYNSRNVSMQVEEVFKHAQYDDIVKVVSIWIVFNAPKHKQGCINRYRMVEEHIIGNACEEEKYFDKQQILVLLSFITYKCSAANDTGLSGQRRIGIVSRKRFDAAMHIVGMINKQFFDVLCRQQTCGKAHQQHTCNSSVHISTLFLSYLFSDFATVILPPAGASTKRPFRSHSFT